MKAAGKRRHLHKLLWLLPLLLAGVLYLNVMTVTKFSGQKWRLPSHVYARPLELFAGANITLDEFVWELESLGYREAREVSRSGEFFRNQDQLVVFLRGFSFWDGVELQQKVQIDFDDNGISGILDASNAPVPITRLEPLRIGGIYPDHLEDRHPIELDEVPDLLVEALLAIEDRTFYQHWGVSLRGIARALKADIQAGGLVQGGSTITQQLVKNFYLTSERTLLRKLKELAMAPIVELHFSKEEILETYLNEVYFGQSGQRSIRGIGLASQFYFRRPLNELEIHQMAFLVGTIKGPSHYDPWSKTEAATERRNLVLNVMHQQGLLTAEELLENRNKSLDVWARPARTLNPYPAYMALVRAELDGVYEDEDLRENGLQIFTHLDPQVQRRLELVANEELAAIESQRGIDQGTLETSAVVTRVGSAEVVAIVGGRKAGFDGFNRALDAKRAIGSLIKPVIYLHALKQPEFSLASIISDESFSVSAPDETEWSPKNYDLQSRGDVILLDAFVNSYNQATARLGLEMGVEQVIATLESLGIEVDWPTYPATLLGAGGMTALDVSELYQVFANDGFRASANAIESIYSTDNQPLLRFQQDRKQVMEASHAHILQYALQMVMLEGTGKSALQWLEPSRRVAGKTGTTNDYRDSWFAGFGGDYLAVFWVGRDDNESMSLTGASGAMRLWANFMAKVETRPVDFVQPKNVNYQWINKSNGRLSASVCDNSVLVPFIKGTEPNERDACGRRIVPRVIDWFRDVLGGQN